MELVKKYLKVMGKIISWACIIVSVLAGLYVGGWVMFIQPIMTACEMLDAGTLTAVIVGKTVIKCLLAGTVGTAIVYLGLTVSSIINMLTGD